MRRPRQLSEEIASGEKAVVIDEIQKIPRLLDEVHRLIEERRIRFLLTGSSARKAITRSKFYFFDIGVVNHMTKRTPISSGNPAFGDAFEHFIVMEARAFLGLTGKDTPLHFWRTKNGYEVDLVIGDELAVEIKATKQVGPRHLRGLRALKEEGLVKEYAVVSLDPVTRVMEPGIKAIFWEDFLKRLWEGRLV